MPIRSELLFEAIENYNCDDCWMNESFSDDSEFHYVDTVRFLQ